MDDNDDSIEFDHNVDMIDLVVEMANDEKKVEDKVGAFFQEDKLYDKRNIKANLNAHDEQKIGGNNDNQKNQI